MDTHFQSLVVSLNDHELSLLIHYQWNGLMKNKRKVLLEEIARRKLTKDSLQRYSTEKLQYPEDHELCKNCGSNKLYEDSEFGFREANYTTYKIQITTQSCRICNFNPSMAFEPNLFKRIKRFFCDKKKTTTVLKRYDQFDDLKF